MATLSERAKAISYLDMHITRLEQQLGDGDTGRRKDERAALRDFQKYRQMYRSKSAAATLQGDDK